MKKWYLVPSVLVITIIMSISFFGCGDGDGSTKSLIASVAVSAITGDTEGAKDKIREHATTLAQKKLEPFIAEVEKEVDRETVVNVFQHRRDEILPTALEKYLNDTSLDDFTGKEKAKQAVILAVKELSNNNG